jgi:hypothetical protein
MNKKNIFKIGSIILVPLCLGFFSVEYIKHKNQSISQNKIVSLHIELSPEKCGSTECRKECLKNEYSYEGTRAIGTNIYGSKKYQCFCIDK